MGEDKSIFEQSLKAVADDLAKAPKRFTLLFSQKSFEMHGGNRARQDDGTEVLYTCMTDEKEHGPWKQNYLWDDAKVVGGIDEYSQVFEHNIMPQGINHLMINLLKCNMV